MEVEKHTSNSTATPSYEPSSRRDDTLMGPSRSYECTFCKGGFTNAQALGGHMNIHRKDRLKAASKQQKKNSNNNNKCHQEASFSRKSNYDHRVHYATIHEQQFHQPYYNNDQFHYYPIPPPSNPGYQQHHHHRNQYHTRYEGDFMGANDLSLRVGPTDTEGEGGRGEWNGENEKIDLELRLGHHKYY